MFCMRMYTANLETVYPLARRMRRSRKDISEADSRIRPNSLAPGMPYPFTAYEMYAMLSNRIPNVWTKFRKQSFNAYLLNLKNVYFLDVFHLSLVTLSYPGCIGTHLEEE